MALFTFFILQKFMIFLIINHIYFLFFFLLSFFNLYFLNLHYTPFQIIHILIKATIVFNQSMILIIIMHFIDSYINNINN